MMNPVYTGILQQQKDKQLQGPSKEAWSMDRTGGKLLQCWSRMQHQRWDWIQVHLQHSLGLDLSLHGDPNITGRGPTYSSREQLRYSSFSGPSQRIIQVLKKHWVQMLLSLLVCFAVICFSVIFSHYFLLPSNWRSVHCTGGSCHPLPCQSPLCHFAVTNHSKAGHMLYWAFNCPFVGSGVVWYCFDT